MGARAGTGAEAATVEDRCNPFKSTLATFPDLSSDVAVILDTAAAARRTLIGVCATWDTEEDGWLGNALTATTASFDVDVDVVEDALRIFDAVTGKVTETDCTDEEEDTDIFVAV